MKTLVTMKSIQNWVTECFPVDVSNTRINPSNGSLTLFFKSDIGMDAFTEFFISQGLLKDFRLSRSKHTIEVHFKDKHDDIDWIEGRTYYNHSDVRAYKLNEIIGNYYYFTIFEGSSSNLVVTHHSSLIDTWSEDYESSIEKNIHRHERKIEGMKNRLERDGKDAS